MSADGVAAQLVEFVSAPQAAEPLVASLPDSDLPAVAEELKRQALFFQRRDAPRALAITDLILAIASSRDAPSVRALGLQAKAVILTLAYREFEEALRLFDASETIYRTMDEEGGIAVGYATKVWALACMQRYDEALAAGAWAAEILAEREAYRTLATLNNNLAAIYGRRGQDAEALQRILEVEEAYARLGEEGQRRLPLALNNRAIVLRNLGQFAESIAANEAALAQAAAHDQPANIARAEQNLGITYFLLGQSNKARALLQKARDTFLADGRFRDAILVELSISDGLLYLRRFTAVLEKCRQVRETFAATGTPFEVAQAWLNEATALAGLGAYDRAGEALASARQIFAAEGNEAWLAYTGVEESALRLRQGDHAAAAEQALACAANLKSLNLPVKEARARLIAARAALAQGEEAQARMLVDQALQTVRAEDVPVLAYQAHALRAEIARSGGDPATALAAFEAAIRELERLQGQIMVEFRADFLADKEEVYIDAVDLCLEAANPRVALAFAERAKSRALLAMLAHHVELKVVAHNAADEPLVARILELREKRDQLYRRWESGETPGSTANRDEEQQSGQHARHEARRQILETEDEIRTLWHRLLVRNAAYARDAALWQVPTRPELAALDPDTLLVEFFPRREGLVAFLVAGETVSACPLPATLEEIGHLQTRLQHNFNTLRQAPFLAASLAGKARQVLHALFLALVAPWLESAAPYRRLVIVPHGPLHYLPFQALFDGQDYLLRRFQISYLPGSSFVDLDQRAVTPGSPRALVMGHSHHGRLPHVQEEARAVARACAAEPYLEERASRARFQEEAPAAQIVHLAAHGDYRPHNPLFSGLHLQEGLLTTLDIFNMRLTASLVALSACQTGRNVVSGGDELFGLMRALLAAGAASLLLTLWPVEDSATAQLMDTFYGRLLAGESKVVALQGAQAALVDGAAGSLATHPYFWAPFFLVGAAGPL